MCLRFIVTTFRLLTERTVLHRQARDLHLTLLTVLRLQHRLPLLERLAQLILMNADRMLRINFRHTLTVIPNLRSNRMNRTLLRIAIENQLNLRRCAIADDRQLQHSSAAAARLLAP